VLVPGNPGVLKSRIDKAVAEKRCQNALDLAKTLYRIEKTPQTLDLLIRVAQGRAQQLAQGHHSRDAAAVIAALVHQVQAPQQMEELAAALAEYGDFESAFQLARQLTSSSLLQRIQGHMADAALRGQPVPTDTLPATFATDKTAVLKAFHEVEAGQDEAARASLQTIGLTSPFLEWKLLLRGLMAYYQNDDGRALENWQRLQPQRLPARLAAPFRQVIDPGFRQAQTQETRLRLQKQHEHLQGTLLTPKLHQVQQSLGNPRLLMQAFRQVEILLPELRSQAAGLVPRLAACFFWAIVEHGSPDGLDRYRRIFGAPAEDPDLARMEALAVERRGDLEHAHEAWQRYLQAVDRHAGALPPGHARRIGALVWHHLAHNASEASSDGEVGFPFFDRQDAPRLKPKAEGCYQRSLELAPDLLEVHFSLVSHYLDHGQKAKAIKAAKQLLKQFPDHVQTLELVGELALGKGSFRDAVTYLTRAAEINPLAGRVRGKLALAHTMRAGHLWCTGKHDKARAEYQNALRLAEGTTELPVLCNWAMVEFHSGDPARAEELLQRAAQKPGQQLALAYMMLILSTRNGLKQQLQDRFAAEVKKELAVPPTAASARLLAVNFAFLKISGPKEPGMKQHEKKVLAYLAKAHKVPFAEPDLVEICRALRDLKATKELQQFFLLGQTRYPKNPEFYLAEIDYNLALPPYRVRVDRIKLLLDKLREMAAALPQGERQGIIEQIEGREEEFRERFPFFRLDGMLSGWPGDEFDDDFEDDDDDWDV
jgi:tetratricopeptide (TPR) repeat protein